MKHKYIAGLLAYILLVIALLATNPVIKERISDSNPAKGVVQPYQQKM